MQVVKYMHYLTLGCFLLMSGDALLLVYRERAEQHAKEKLVPSLKR